ncbi:MAG: DUF3472 domain-containing protein [Acidobacteria bacterium]|nr:DUF3472 domain-containing protein [Acidobacteriota bacterium]MYE44947.1 DUF3472 domain-containing protein [Acidobacteriota bacterium]
MERSPIPLPTVPEPAPPPTPEDLIVPPAEAGKVARDRIRLTLTSEAGAPLPDTPFEWNTDEHSGWVFPAEGRTDEEGVIDAAWIPGFPGEGQLVLTFTEDGEQRTREFATNSLAPANPPWGGHALGISSPVASGYSIDLTPLTEPLKTYYAAMNWTRGYAGLQRDGDLYDRQLQFSQWDASSGTPPEVVDVGDGVHCRRFTHEGSGVQCGAEYPWAVGKTYRFEMTTEPGAPGFAHYSLHVTDLESGTRRYIGTLRASGRGFHTGIIPFVEDFQRVAPTCLDQEVRSAAFRRAMARTDAGWVPLVNATVRTHVGEDAGNPGTPECANYDVRDHPAGLELLIGGTNVHDPHLPVRVTIPE